MRDKRRNCFLSVLSLLILLGVVSGCGNNDSEDRVNEELEKVSQALNSLKVQIANQKKQYAKQSAELTLFRNTIHEELNSFSAELASFKNGEMVSFRTDLDAIQKRLAGAVSRPKQPLDE